MKRLNHFSLTLAVFSVLLAIFGLNSPVQASQVEPDSQQLMLLAEGEEDPENGEGEEDPPKDTDGDGIPDEEDPTPTGPSSEEDPENGDDSDG